MSRKLAIGLLIFLAAGEIFNYSQTAERIVNSREDLQAPARAALDQHEAAKKNLTAVEAGAVNSTRLSLALAAAKAAKAAYETEASNIRCGKECLRQARHLRPRIGRGQGGDRRGRGNEGEGDRQGESRTRIASAPGIGNGAR